MSPKSLYISPIPENSTIIYDISSNGLSTFTDASFSRIGATDGSLIIMGDLSVNGQIFQQGSTSSGSQTFIIDNVPNSIVKKIKDLEEKITKLENKQEQPVEKIKPKPEKKILFGKDRILKKKYLYK